MKQYEQRINFIRIPNEWDEKDAGLRLRKIIDSVVDNEYKITIKLNPNNCIDKYDVTLDFVNKISAREATDIMKKIRKTVKEKTTYMDAYNSICKKINEEEFLKYYNVICFINEHRFIFNTDIENLLSIKNELLSIEEPIYKLLKHIKNDYNGRINETLFNDEIFYYMFTVIKNLIDNEKFIFSDKLDLNFHFMNGKDYEYYNIMIKVLEFSLQIIAACKTIKSESYDVWGLYNEL